MAVLFPAPEWAHATNIYEVNLRQYTKEGTIQAFMKHLPRLAEMGVQVLWLMPVKSISEKGRKGSLGSYYAGSSFRKINPEFGSEGDFRNLVEETHRLGMKIIIDWVANHTGMDHEWTRSHPEFYTRDANGDFTERNGWDDVIDLDYNNRELHKTMISSMRWWLDTFGIDGFRCDMAHLVPLSFWKEARAALDSDQPHFWLAECEESDYHQVFDASYTWEWMHATERFAQHQCGTQELWELLYKQDHLFPPEAMRAYFTSNHDENSWNGTEYEKFDGLALPLAVFSSTWNGLPLLYSGQELPNLKRLKFFDKDEIEWSETPALASFYKKLLELRAAHPALRAADSSVATYRVPGSNPRQVWCFLRASQGRRVLVVLNFSGIPLTFRPESALTNGSLKELFSEQETVFSEETELTLEPYGYQVWFV